MANPSTIAQTLFAYMALEAAQQGQVFHAVALFTVFELS